jgi:hypothetical protein
VFSSHFSNSAELKKKKRYAWGVSLDHGKEASL